MKNLRIIAAVVALVAAVFFALVSLAEAGAKKDPIWSIFKPGTAKSVNLKVHEPNPRFAIYDSGTPDDDWDDWVLDKQTGIVWQRRPSGVIWEASDCYGKAVYETYEAEHGGLRGQRLPTLEEMLSLVDPTMSEPALPAGHPFIEVQWEDWIMEGSDWYWTATDWRTIDAFVVNFNYGNISYRRKECQSPKDVEEAKVWRVWGGSVRVDYIFTPPPQP